MMSLSWSFGSVQAKHLDTGSERSHKGRGYMPPHTQNSQYFDIIETAVVEEGKGCW